MRGAAREFRSDSDRLQCATTDWSRGGRRLDPASIWTCIGPRRSPVNTPRRARSDTQSNRARCLPAATSCAGQSVPTSLPLASRISRPAATRRAIAWRRSPWRASSVGVRKVAFKTAPATTATLSSMPSSGRDQGRTSGRERRNCVRNHESAACGGVGRTPPIRSERPLIGVRSGRSGADRRSSAAAGRGGQRRQRPGCGGQRRQRPGRGGQRRQRPDRGGRMSPAAASGQAGRQFADLIRDDGADFAVGVPSPGCAP